MRRLGRLSPAMLLVLLVARSEAAPVPTPPNIVIVLCDDLGYSDIGAFGGEIETPHLDRLAAGGVRMTQFYNAGRCCPTRAALLTGVYSHRAGVGHMSADYGVDGYRGRLSESCVTIAEALRPAGYRTLMCGKWHVGSERGHWPRDRGFDRYYGSPEGGGVYFKGAFEVRGEIGFYLDDVRQEISDDWYVTDALTDHAIRFVEEAVALEQPFFLYLAHIAPHWPLQARPGDIEKYRGRYDRGWDAVREARHARQKTSGIVDARWPLSPRHAKAKAWKALSAKQREDLAHRMAVYAAQVDRVDQGLGRLLARLDSLEAIENTLIIFLSDNGCSAEGGPGGFRRGDRDSVIGTGDSYASAGLEWANASDTPFRRFKKNLHEGGIATPCILHWPAGIVRPGRLDARPAHVIDLLPTCLEIARAPYPARRTGKPTVPVAGASLVPVLRDEPHVVRHLYWEHEGNRAVRQGDWKLVADAGQPWELYDLARDRTELNDLAAAHPDIVEILAGAWRAWSEEAGVEPWPEVRHRHGER